MARLVAAASLVTIAIACSSKPTVRPPQPLRVEPSQADEGTHTDVVIVGEDFHTLVTVDFTRNVVETNASFTAQLGSTPLAEVAYVDPQRLTAVVPGTLPPGEYELSVEDPRGQVGLLSGAFVVRQPCASDSECSDNDACNGEESCLDGECLAGAPPDCGQSDACVVRGCDAATGCTTEWTAEADRDLDTFISTACGGDDCDDDPSTCGAGCFPSNTTPDVCDTYDQDCDQAVDEEPDLVWYEDADSDGHGNAASSTSLCTRPPGYVSLDDDCNDMPGSGAAIYPGATETVADSVDQDCNGQDRCYQDLDGDGHGTASTTDDVDGDLDCTTGTGVSAASDDCDDDPGACGAACSPDLGESWRDANCADSYDNDCAAGADLADPACPNLPPIARVSVTPHSSDTATIFAADASASHDANTAASALQVRWDCQNDGLWDTGFATAKTHNCGYASNGLYSVLIEVMDDGGLSSHRWVPVAVIQSARHHLVDTAVDEGDPGATPGAPAGTGFSLREAIAFANSNPGSDHISFATPLTIVLDSPLPTIDNPDRTNIIGDTVIDGSNLAPTETCVTVASSNAVTLGYLEIRSCAGVAVHLAGSGARVRNSILRDNGIGVWIESGTAGNVVGPDNEITGSSSGGVRVEGAGRVRKNAIHGNGADGVLLVGNGSRAALNRVWSNGGCGIRVHGGAANVVVRKNTVDLSGSSGLCVDLGPGSGHDVQNNLFSGSTAHGIAADGADLAVLDYNAYFANTSGACSACTPGTRSVAADPLHINPAAGDYRLLPGSPLVDAGADLGNDVNGPAPGNFAGAAPDIGAWESAYP